MEHFYKKMMSRIDFDFKGIRVNGNDGTILSIKEELGQFVAQNIFE